MPTIRVNDVDLFVEESGSGEPILFVHGYTGSHDSWDSVVPRLADRYRCIVMDLRGAGDSGHPPGGYSIEQYAADVIGVADALGLDRFTYVGHSMGGHVGMWLGLEHADRLTRLVLVAPGMADGSMVPATLHEEAIRKRRAGAREEMLAERIAQNARSERVDEALEARRVDRALSVSDGHLEDSFQAMRGLRIRDRLGEIRTPTLVVSGGADWLLAANLQDVQLLPNASLHVLSRVGHRIPTEVPAALSRVLADFMEHGVVNAATIQGRVDEVRAAAAR
ncbi:MAG: alpha/beta hydrolase [Chloroflexi bacterium]|nr:alpha/beta hydrolase [Chloroflexota bacterium]